jgi:RNA polymerase sigma-70 factor (ECF subfamily)
MRMPGGSFNDGEADLIARAQAGDRAAFEELYRAHWARTYGLCLRMTHNRDDAEDFTQEAFLMLFRKLHQFRGESGLSTYLFRIASNVVKMSFRNNVKASNDISLEEFLEYGEGDSRERVEFGKIDRVLNLIPESIDLHRVIEELPDDYRVVFDLHEIQQYEHQEIADMLGIKINNSKSRLYRARKILRRELLKGFRPGRKPFNVNALPRGIGLR